MSTLEDILAGVAFQMQATGSSMAPAVLDGDVVPCSARQPRNGEIAIVSIDDGPAEMWRLSTHASGLIRLFRPNSPSKFFKPEEAAGLKFWGTVVGIVRPFPQPANENAAPDAPTSEAAKDGK